MYQCLLNVLQHGSAPCIYSPSSVSAAPSLKLQDMSQSSAGSPSFGGPEGALPIPEGGSEEFMNTNIYICSTPYRNFGYKSYFFFGFPERYAPWSASTASSQGTVDLHSHISRNWSKGGGASQRQSLPGHQSWYSQWFLRFAYIGIKFWVCGISIFIACIKDLAWLGPVTSSMENMYKYMHHP